MANADELVCDGCGQRAASGHIAKRLRRLEQATRYRPVHIGTLFLGAIAPREDAEFLYASNEAAKFLGEAELLLSGAGISWQNRERDAILSDFQRGGFFLAHILECAIVDSAQSDGREEQLCAARLPMAVARIRRSLKPKRVVLISRVSDEVLAKLRAAELGCPILLDAGKPYALDGASREHAASRLREVVLGSFGQQ